MGVYLCAKFEVSSIILTSFRRGSFTPPTSKGTPKKPTQIRVNEIDTFYSSTYYLIILCDSGKIKTDKKYCRGNGDTVLKPTKDK